METINFILDVVCLGLYIYITNLFIGKGKNTSRKGKFVYALIWIVITFLVYKIVI